MWAMIEKLRMNLGSDMISGQKGGRFV